MRGIVLSLLVLSSAAHGFDYCTSKCKRGGVHTMCKYKTEDPGRHCKNYEEHFLTSREKKDILDKHNELRALIARGEVPNQPKGLDVKDLAWSEENELIARRWALQCTYEHDLCRETKDGEWTSQNLGISASDEGFKGDHLNQVQEWFDEHKVYTPAKKNLFPKGGKTGVGHYTALVWGKTTHVGCERTYFHYKYEGHDKYPGSEYLVCVYSPGGNVGGKQVYQTEPGDQPGKPTEQPDEPGEQPGKPAEQPGQPGEQPGQPGEQPGQPGEQPGKPDKTTPALGVKRESCVCTLVISLVIALKSNFFTGCL